MPRVDDLLDQVGQARFISTLDGVRPHQGVLAGPDGEDSSIKDRLQESIWTLPVLYNALWITGSSINVSKDDGQFTGGNAGLCSCLP